MSGFPAIVLLLQWYGSVLVVVFAVECMAMTIVDVIDVVSVLDSFVAAALAVLVFGNSVFGYCFMLVVVVTVEGVMVGAMHVIDVVAMLDSFVATAFAVLVFGYGVLGVEIANCHCWLLSVMHDGHRADGVGNKNPLILEHG